MAKSLTKKCLDKQVKVRRKYSPAKLFLYLKNDNGVAIVDRDSEVFKEAGVGDMEALMHSTYGWDFEGFEDRTIYFEVDDPRQSIVGGVYNLATKAKETAVELNGPMSPYHYGSQDMMVFALKYKKVLENA